LLSAIIISLVFDERYEEAEALLDAERRKLPEGQAYRLMALSEVLREELARCGNNGVSIRRALARVHKLSDMLMDAEYWGDSVSVLGELISLSTANDERFFLGDGRFRRAVCLKALGRMDEFEKAKAEIPVGTKIFMGRGLWGVDDI
jgi:hypothetical protein